MQIPGFPGREKRTEAMIKQENVSEMKKQLSFQIKGVHQIPSSYEWRGKIGTIGIYNMVKFLNSKNKDEVLQTSRE